MLVQGPRRMSADEAVREGEGYCRGHGYGCRMLDVDLTGDGRFWRVNYDAEGRGTRGRLHLEFDAYTRQLLRADEPRPVVIVAPPPPSNRPHPLNAEEARRKGDDFCRSRGYACRLIDQDYFGGHVWKMNYDVVGGGRGRVHIEFDALDHRMVNVREDVRR